MNEIRKGSKRIKRVTGFNALSGDDAWHLCKKIIDRAKRIGLIDDGYVVLTTVMQAEIPRVI